MTTLTRDQPRIWYEAYKFDDKRFIYIIERKILSWRRRKIKGFNTDILEFLESN